MKKVLANSWKAEKKQNGRNIHMHTHAERTLITRRIHTHTSMSTKSSTDRRIGGKNEQDRDEDLCLEKLPQAADQANRLCVMCDVVLCTAAH